MKKILAVILILLMAVQMVPFAASAEELEHAHAHDHGEETLEAAVPDEEPEAEETASDEPAEEPAEETAAPVSEEEGKEAPDKERAPAETDLRNAVTPSAEPAAVNGSALETDAEPKAVSMPTSFWLEPSDATKIPSRIDVFKKTSGTTTQYQIYLPGNAVVSECRLSWDGGLQATVGGTSYDSGACPIPAANETKTYSFKNGTQTSSFSIVTYKGSAGVTPIFIEIDESEGNYTIAQMDGDADHNIECKGDIWIAGTKYVLSKMKGRGNATWKEAKDKKPYNITVGEKIQFPGIDSEKTKKWSLLAENLDRSLLGNRAGYWLAYEMGIGQDTASADVWMNGEYQGCYTVTPKTDSFVTKNGFMIEQDNYKEDPVADGGDPQFTLEGLKEASGWDSCYNRITVKQMGDNLLKNEAGVVDESPENMEAAAGRIKVWLQNAWDAIRRANGTSDEGKYYTEYIDIESFAKMYLMHEYVKSYDVCAGSILYHRDGQTDADKLYAGPLWDLDNAMGSTYQNSSLGKADDRRNGDRRSAEGTFIQNVTEYKTSVYKTIYQHDDFKAEVKNQYNKYRTKFEKLEADFQQMADEIEESALMNYHKVNDLGNGTGKNNHYYRNATTLGSGQYRQQFVATSSWANYVTNMKIYIATRSLWFKNTYTDPNYVCEHEYQKKITVAPTCTSEGTAVYTCIYCEDSYTESVEMLPHTYETDVTPPTCTSAGYTTYTCSVCGHTYTDDPVDALGHIWSAASYEWADDNSSVTASRTCSRDASHSETDSAETTSKITKQATCEDKGETTYTATFTNSAFETQSKTVADIPATGHTPGAAVRENEKAATCEAEGSYDEVTYCTVCGKETSRTKKTIPATGHTPGTAVRENEKAATCEEDGSYDLATYCTVCKKELSRKTEPIPAKGHSWNTPTYTWSNDNKTVTAKRTCANDASHPETETVTTTKTTKDPTCEAKGETTYTAIFTNSAFSKQTKTVEIPAKGHTPGAAVEENRKAETCTEAGSYDLVTYCTVCEEELSRETKTVPAKGHSWNTPTYTWTTDNSEVTAKRTCANDASHPQTETVKTTKTTKDPTCEAKGETTFTATFTNSAFSKQTKTVEIPAKGHTAGAAVEENRKAETCTEAGSYDLVTYCTVCEEELSRETKTVPAKGHSWNTPTYTWTTDNSEVTAKRTCANDASHPQTETVKTTKTTKDPTCEAKGETTFTATFTNSAFSKQTKTVEIPTKGHTAGSAVRENEKAATCEADGSYDEVTYCTVCGKELSRTKKTIAAAGHKAGTAVRENEKSATCEADGSYDEVTYCTVCGKELSRTKKTIAATGHKAGTAVRENEKAATCTADGSYDEVTYCTVCKKELSRKTITVPAKGHSWNTPTYTWSSDYSTVTATRTCKNDSSHKETETANTTSAVTTQPTCTAKGKTTYTATFTNSAFAKQTKTVENVNALGHTPGSPVKENEKAATCTTDGSYDEVTYCTVCKKELTRETKTVPATGHDWGKPSYEWAKDNSTATASRTCSHDASHVDKETVKTTSKITKDPTCEEPGETTWTAAFTNKAFTSQTKTEANIPALGHEPGEPVTENTVPPTATADGSHDEVVYCTRCGKELSRKTVTDKLIPPAFKTQSLVLSGEIGVNFYMDLSGLTDKERSASYMEFTVGKTGAPVQAAFNANKTNDKGYYGFTCYVTSIQMADTITAVYHYGNGNTVSKEYSVERYIQAIENNASSYSDKMVALARAIADYGYYAQIYLSDLHTWTIGNEYAAMSLHFTDKYDHADILSKVQGKAFVKTISGSNVTAAAYKLHLDSETTVDVFLTTSDGTEPANVKLTVRNEETGKTTTAAVTPVKQSDGRYMIRVTGISAHKLGDMMTITGTAGKQFEIQVSALSYVRSVLNSDSQSVYAKNCVAALYKYYEKVLAYRR